MNDPKTSKSFVNLSEEDQDWVLNYLSWGKGTIPYQLIIDFDSFNILPGKDFFEEYLFYSNMKDSNISAEDYENVKKFYTLSKFPNLGDLNRLYNFQDTIMFKMR